MFLFPLDLASTIILAVLVLLVTCFFLNRHRADYPHCPTRPWPILGHLFLLEADPRQQFSRFRKQCGDLFSLYLGTTHTIIINGSDLAKEAYIKQGDDFSEKAFIFMDLALGGLNKGIVSSNGEVWRENRSTCVNILRNFGFGKNILAQRVRNEVQHYCELLESLNGQPKNVFHFNSIGISNTMCAIIIGKRFDYDDEKFQRIMSLIDYNLAHLRGTALLNYFPCLRYLPGDLFKFKQIEKNFDEFFDMFGRSQIKVNENVTGEAENFIAAYIQEMKKRQAARQSTTLDESQLLKNIWDLWAGGTITSAATISWFMLYMLNYPEVQEKAYREIEAEIGLERAPNIEDKTKLKYIFATIMETQRLANLVPLHLPRELSKDTTLGGYTLPKGSQIMVNMDSLLMDKDAWGEDVDKFKPERFIGKDGSLFIPDSWLPFSFGRRVCIGESLAKMELFLFIATIIQRFKLLPADPESIPPIKGYFGIVHSPVPFEIRLVSRRT